MSRIYTASPDFPSQPVRGYTLVALLDEACEKHPNATAYNQPTEDGWKSFSNTDFRTAAEDIALALTKLDLVRGDRVVFYMNSDVYYCMSDMGCLLAGFVDVPIYLTNAADVTLYVMQHAEARALFVSNAELLERIAPTLEDVSTIKTVILIDDTEPERAQAAIPSGLNLLTLNQLRTSGHGVRTADPDRLETLKSEISPQDVATLIYTSGTTGRPKGVMLTHENISYNGITAFNGLTGVGHGDSETVLSFLPMTHIFARTLNYGAMAYGHSIYFTSVDQLGERFQEIRPTLFATVPRVLEKVYDKIMLKGQELSGVKRKLFDWAMAKAKAYEIGKEPAGWDGRKLGMARKLVFSKWQAALGGRVKYVIAGGAALNGTLANQFAAAGITILQGYGLTETSPVITYNRPGANRAGTVGTPMTGVEVMIADDGEILTRGPHVMKGYYRNPEATHEAIDEEGWFHTGDIGEFSDDNFLRITDRKKSMFKLSTGKYVVPAPIESALKLHPLIEQAVIVGVGYKYTTALLFPNQEMLKQHLNAQGMANGDDMASLCADEKVRALFEPIVEEANTHGSHWEHIKRFTLVPDLLSIENGLLTPTLKVKRGKVAKAFDTAIAGMYVD